MPSGEGRVLRAGWPLGRCRLVLVQRLLRFGSGSPSAGGEGEPC